MRGEEHVTLWIRNPSFHPRGRRAQLGRIYLGEVVQTLKDNYKRLPSQSVTDGLKGWAHTLDQLCFLRSG